MSFSSMLHSNHIWAHLNKNSTVRFRVDVFKLNGLSLKVIIKEEASLSSSSKTVIQKYWNAFALGSVYDW